MSSKKVIITDVLAATIALGLVLAIAMGDMARTPIASSETQFAEFSPGGLALVPASCPSSPHYSGECTVPPQPSSGCTITASKSSITAGEEVAIAWSSVSSYSDPYTRTISPTIGSVVWSGVRSIRPTQTTTYTFTGTHANAASNFSCSVTVNVAASCAPTYFCSGSNLMYRNNQCAESLNQACAYGCSGGGCLPPPAGTGTITVSPALVRSGETTQVSWSTTNVVANSCTVVEDNPEITNSWTGATGTRTSGTIRMQTHYTLTCTGLDGGTVTDSATVNVIPVFEET